MEPLAGAGQAVTHTITAAAYAAGRVSNGIAVLSPGTDVASINNTASSVITVVASPPGAPGLTSTGASEVFTPTSSTWSPTSAMSIPRAGATLTVLGDGTVLIRRRDRRLREPACGRRDW